eukprot:CAMPEP_0170579976 /NCGR_PEP_ID=MMETSP0224-20130122/6268_1 /TAXON_ID=285029 /ORGANISM="Togula jolla, Strain CCCM 725" /LENGTH=216 /DNA_ID=CAMNT_0010903031 /DNA_START=12 /DNA_END=662 /DNA_ORIENTATION=+
MVIIDRDGSTITREGRAALSNDPTGERFPWYPSPVFNLSEGPGDIEHTPMVIALCETNSQAAQEAIEERMTPTAQRFLDEAKAKGEDPGLIFGIGCSRGGLCNRIRGVVGLPLLPALKHKHPLEKTESEEGAWQCDGCAGGGAERYSCTEGCDFDFCGECNANAGSGKELPPKLVIFDIPDDMACYEGPEGDVTEEVLAKFVADYQAKRLQKKKLG